MTNTTHIRTSNKTYYGTIILCLLFICYESAANDQSLFKTISNISGIIAVIILFSFYKIVFGKGKIILSESEFKVQGYQWTNWNELTGIHSVVEQDTENGEQYYIKFRLSDGSDISVRSEHLEMSFDQIAELVNQYRTNYAKNKNVS